jgi:hypothetical protein
MAEIRTVTTLRKKQADIIRTIDAYEVRIAKARADLAHVKAIIRLFEASDSPHEITPYADIHRLYRYAEIGNLCLDALKAGPLTTPQLGVKLAEAKGFDVTDRALLKTLNARVIASMRSMEKRRKVLNSGRCKIRGNGRVCVWTLPIDDRKH